MGKASINEDGFTSVELVVVVIMVILISVIGWFVYKDHHHTISPATKPSTSTTAQPIVYKRTTTVPSNWKTYTNTSYKFDTAYPSGWSVSFHDFYAASQLSSLGLSASENTAELCYLPAGVTQTCDEEMDISRLSLQNAASQFYSSGGLKKSEVTQISLTIDGNPALEFTNLPSSFPPQKDYYIFANGYTYEMPTVYTTKDKTNLLSAQNSLILFESVKLN